MRLLAHGDLRVQVRLHPETQGPIDGFGIPGVDVLIDGDDELADAGGKGSRPVQDLPGL